MRFLVYFVRSFELDKYPGYEFEHIEKPTFKPNEYKAKNSTKREDLASIAKNLQQSSEFSGQDEIRKYLNKKEEKWEKNLKNEALPETSIDKQYKAEEIEEDKDAG